MAWLSLIISGLCETFAVAMINRLTLKQNWQTVIAIVIGLGAALAFLSYALQPIPMGTGYVVWTGISVVSSTLIGMIFFKESKSWLRIFFMTLILSCAIGLKIIS